MAFASASSDGTAPMGEMNTTPLIDVMLVLLIMFILTIPVQMHATKVDLPGQGGTTATLPQRHRIDVDALGLVYWDGARVDTATLGSRLAAAAAADAEVLIKPDGYARYELVNRVLASVQRNGVTRIGFIGNEALAN